MCVRKTDDGEEYETFSIRLTRDMKKLLRDTSFRLKISEMDVIRLALLYFCGNENAMRLVEYGRIAQRRRRM